MARKSGRSIRTKIISYMLLVSLVPILAIAGLVWFNMSNTSDTVTKKVGESRDQLGASLQVLEEDRTIIGQQNVENNAVNMTELMLSQMQSYLDERIRELQIMAGDIRIVEALQYSNIGPAEGFIQCNQTNNEFILEINITDSENGDNIISTSSDPVLILRQRDWWKTAAAGNLYISDADWSDEFKTHTVRIAFPITVAEGSEFIGVFEAIIAFDALQMVEQWGEMIPDSYVLLVNRDHGLIADSANPDRHLQPDPYWSRTEQDALSAIADNNNEPSYIIKDEEIAVFCTWDSIDSQTSYANGDSSPDMGWTLMMVIPKNIAFATFESVEVDDVLASLDDLGHTVEDDTTMIFSFLMVILALVSLLVFVIALGVSRSLTNPIVKLHRGVLEVMSGNWDHKVGSEANDEIGEVSRAFDEMTVAIYTAQGQLKNYSKSLERMVENRTQYLQKEISERQRAEEGLREAHSQLKQAHEELKSSQEQLLQSAKLAAVGQLVSGVAHEVNNPLMAISGNAEMLLKKTEDEKMRKRLQRVYDETGRAIAIVRNLLSFARKRDSEKVPVMINEVIDSVIQLRAYDMSLDDIKIEFIAGDDIPEVLADFQQLQQVFLNLMINAEWAIRDAGDGGTITIEAKRDRKNLKVTVTDDGSGIPEDIQERIFEPFFTTKDVGEGTGLGLSICYGIIEDHNGKISVESKPGKGTTFTLEIPAIK